MSNLLEIDIVVDKDNVPLVKQLSGRKLGRAATNTINELLDLIEDTTLISQYTQNAKPAKPLGSDYVRTFRLQDSRRKEIVRDRFPVEGRFRATTNYASFVIGFVDEQAIIHIGRWPSLDLSVTRVENNANKIFNRETKKVKL